MSSSQDIDPRLRDLSSSSQQPNPQHASAIAPHPSSASQLPYPPLHSGGSPHNQSHGFFAHTPQSAGNGADNDRGEASPDGGVNDPKRPRACEACRGLKVKCEPDMNGGPCKRCAKANRACEVTQPSRKRQKKTDSRVADLEKKIEMLQRLTASIHPRAAESALMGIDQQPSYNNSPYPQQVPDNTFSRIESTQNLRPSSVSNEWSPYPKPVGTDVSKTAPMVVEAGRKRKHAESQDILTPSSISNKLNEAPMTFDQVHSVWSDGPGKSPPVHIYSDVIDRKIVTVAEAEQMFECYTGKMAIHLPAVVFPPGTTASSIRKEKPMLLLAILAAAAGPTFPELQLNLTKELISSYATRIMINGEKSLELIQALQVSTLWYYPPEHFEELKFYQMVHIAAVMAIDIGMGKPNRPSKAGASAPGLFRDTAWRRQPFPDPGSIEARRAWLASYFLCCNTSMGLRRPNLIRWTSYMGDCVKVLETSPDAYESDKTLCAWVRSQHIAEEVGIQFSMDDPLAKVSISDDKVNYALKKFEQDIAQWHEDIPPQTKSHTLDMTGHIVSLYMHEIAMHVDHNVEEFKPPYHESTINGLVSDFKSQTLTTSHVEALSACLTAIDGVFEVFFRHSVEVVRCLPVVNFVRVAYATVVLIKMSLAASQPENGIGKIFVASKLKTEEYLDGLINMFSAASADHRSRPSSKFLMVLVMLKTWFQRRTKVVGKPSDVEGPVSNTSGVLDPSRETKQGQSQMAVGPQCQPQPSYVPTNTPLDVLSEVATGNSRGQAGANLYSAAGSDWQQTAIQAPFDSYGTNVMQQGFSDGIGNDPNMNGLLGYSYSPGADGLQHAMGIMEGFGAYLGDDNFFMSDGYSFNGV